MKTIDSESLTRLQQHEADFVKHSVHSQRLLIKKNEIELNVKALENAIKEQTDQVARLQYSLEQINLSLSELCDAAKTIQQEQLSFVDSLKESYGSFTSINLMNGEIQYPI